MKNARRKNSAKVAKFGDDPNEKPYPGYKRELAAIQAKAERAQRASAAPLPGPLRAAFAGEAPTLHGFTLYPVTLNLQVVLTKIHSPMIEITRIIREELSANPSDKPLSAEELAQDQKARLARAHARMEQEIPATEEQHLETIFAFVRPADELLALLARGRGGFTAAAFKAFGNLHPAAFGDLQKAVGAWYSQAFATGVQYEAQRGKDDGTVFTPPPARPTVSAGGSPFSAP